MVMMLLAPASKIARGSENTTTLPAMGPEDKIEVYYFHYSRRCATCEAVESETKKALEEYFKDEMEAGTITFLSVNIEEETNAPMVESMEVSGQSLLFVRGDKKKDLTNDAFMNARTKPEKYRKLVKRTVEDLMK